MHWDLWLGFVAAAFFIGAIPGPAVTRAAAPADRRLQGRWIHCGSIPRSKRRATRSDRAP